MASLAHDGAIPANVDPSVVSTTLRRSINERLDEALALWNDVPVGGDLVLRWPARLAIRRGRL